MMSKLRETIRAEGDATDFWNCRGAQDILLSGLIRGIVTDRNGGLKFYECAAPDFETADLIDICARIGVDTDDVREETSIDTDDIQISVPYDSWRLMFKFPAGDTADLHPACLTCRLNNTFLAAEYGSSRPYAEWIDAVFELTCRLTMLTEAGYVPLYETTTRGYDALPREYPILGSIREPPEIGVFAPSTLDEDGGLDRLYDSPWYTAELADGRTAVVKSSSPWGHEWEPPTETDAEYITKSNFRQDDTG